MFEFDLVGIVDSLILLQVIGAAYMATKTRKHLGQLKDDIASPGGITITGIHELEKGGFRGLFINAIIAASKCSHELSQSFFINVFITHVANYGNELAYFAFIDQ